jgi:hypothetical protein
MNSNNVHSHASPGATFVTTGGAVEFGGFGTGGAYGEQGISRYGSTAGVDINHTHNFTTGGISVNHTHTVSGTTATNAGSSDWVPRYLDIIICSKN